MRLPILPLLALGLVAAASGHAGDAFADFQARTAKYHSVVSLPVFETTPEQVAATADKTIAEGNAMLDRIGKLTPKEVTFKNTFVALDDFGYYAGKASERLSLIEQTSTNAAVRDAATDAIKKLSEWSVGVDYREDVYRALKAFADTHPKLSGEDKRLFDYTMRD